MQALLAHARKLQMQPSALIPHAPPQYRSPSKPDAALARSRMEPGDGIGFKGTPVSTELCSIHGNF